MDSYYFPMAYPGITLNEHRTSAGAEDSTKLNDTIRVDRLDWSRIQQRDQREPLHLLSGGDLGDATAAFRYISLAGTILGSTGAKLSDKISQLMAAFDVEEAQFDSPSTEGIQPFTFTDVTEVVTGRGTAFTDPVSGLSNGQYVLERFMARPAAFPIITARRSGGKTALFSVELVCADPHRYIDTAEAVVLNSGNSFTATPPNWNSSIGKVVYPVLTLVMAGNGASNLSIDANGDLASGPLVLNMAAAGAGTFVIDCATGRITKSSLDVAALRTSAVDTYPRVIPGGSVWTVTNTTNVTSLTIGYRQARG